MAKIKKTKKSAGKRSGSKKRAGPRKGK